MPKVSPKQTSFNAGEIGPLASARTDLDRYQTGLETCENYIPTSQGPLIRRSGTVYMHRTKYATGDVTFIPFKYSRDQAYMVEMGREPDLTAVYMRFYKNNSLLTYTASNTFRTVTGVLAVSPSVILQVSAHQFPNNARLIVSGISGMTQLNNREFVAQSTSANSITLKDPDTSASVLGVAFDTYVSGGVARTVHEISCPGIDPSEDLTMLKQVQSADVIYMVLSGVAPLMKLSRYGDIDWSFSTVELTQGDGPYLPINGTTVTITPSAVTGTATLSASSPIFVSSTSAIRLKNGSTWGYGQLNVVNSTTATCVILSPFASTASTSDWRFGAGRPNAIMFHEDRLWLACSMNRQLIAGSVSSDYENFAPSDLSGTVAADDGLSFLINSEEANANKWLCSDEKGLLAGTAGGPWVIRPNNLGDPLTALNANARQASSYGSADIQPIKADKSTLYVQNSTKKIRELIYFFDVDGFKSADITVLSDHITGPGVSQIVFVKEPQPVLWAPRTDGYLISLTFDRETGNIRAGWARHFLGGYSDVSQTTIPLVQRISVIPSADGSYDEMWTIVTRYINGRSRRFIEYLFKYFEETDDQEDARYLDCALKYDSTATGSISGLNHLEGEVVSIYADGNAQADKTVTNGKITLDISASVVNVGYSYASRGKILPIDAGSADGTAQGKTRRINRVGMNIHNVGQIKIGMDFDSLDEVTLNDDNTLFTGIISEVLESDYDFYGQFCWEQSSGHPGVVRAILPQMVTQDR